MHRVRGQGQAEGQTQTEEKGYQDEVRGQEEEGSENQKEVAAWRYGLVKCRGPRPRLFTSRSTPVGETAPAFFLDNAAAVCYMWKEGPIAQLRLERAPDKREVTGSTPVRPTRPAAGGLFYVDEEPV